MHPDQRCVPCQLAFNRTMLELKFSKTTAEHVAELPFNRTMLELKSDRVVGYANFIRPFNRTMLELKYK